MDEATLNILATRMLSDYDNHSPGLAFADGLQLEVAEALRVQSAVATLREARGETVAGYKIGATTKGNQAFIGLDHPAWGRLWSTELHESNVMLSKANYANPAMEAEFAITLSDSIRPGLTDVDDILPRIAAIHPVIEIHNLVFRGAPPHGAELLANNAINAGVVLGEGITDVRSMRSTDLQLVYDGSVVDNWNALAWPQEMLTAIGWLGNCKHLVNNWPRATWF